MTSLHESVHEELNAHTLTAGQGAAFAANSLRDRDAQLKAEEGGDDEHHGASLVWSKLKVSSKTGKLLLKGISGTVSGGYWAVMGPSGSGKSTLLNALALRLDRAVSIEGDVRLNGEKYDSATLKLMSGYVMQDDVLNGNLSVEETLLYTARLRCPQDTTDEMRRARVNRVLNQMGLAHARYTLVGTPLKKGISGGERKRLAVAQELLTEPRLLFLDEPTSGLDSVTALSLCQTLRELAKTCTIICTIHQPQAKIFNLFDNLVLLQSGDIVYQGLAKDALAYFEKSGFPCPAFTNPADHLLDSMAISRSDSSHSLVSLDEGESSQYIDLKFGADRPKVPLRATTPWTRQFGILLERNMKEQMRKTGVLTTQLIQTVVMAVLIGTAFLQIGDDQLSVKKRQPVLFFCCINQGLFGALTTINSFPGERVLALRERAAGTYYASAYFLSKVIAETVIQLPQPAIFSCIVYWLVGLQHDVSKFFIFATIMCLCSMAATSLALAVSAVCRTTDLSVTVLPMALEVSRLFGGFFLSPAILPGYFAWLDALSYVKYSYVAVSVAENSGLDLTCTPDEEIVGASGELQCPIPNGETVLEGLGMADWHVGFCAGILLLYIVVVRAIAFVAVRRIKW